MDAALRLCLGHALHPVSAGFELEPAIGPVARNAQNHFLVATQVTGAFADEFRRPALAFGVAGVHAQQVCGEQRRFLTARSGADFDKDIVRVVRIARKQRNLQLRVQRLQSRAGVQNFLLRKVFHVRVAQQPLGLGQVVLPCTVAGKQGSDGLQLGMFPRQCTVAIHVRGAVGRSEQGVELGHATLHLLEFVLQ
ncbi:hypothetical protein GALL_510420 [mine drainage metagenome]|uniref:Uncharacterized protein n=1 Tax=mine drainage metagenome TaxID=410659 RepID=A0A1J5PQ13_9ZZZZ